MSSANPGKSGRFSKVDEDQQSDLSDSWVTCDVDGESSTSLSKEMERLLREAQQESGQSSLSGSSKSSKSGSSLSSTSCNSPRTTPNRSGGNSPFTESPPKTPPEALETVPELTNAATTDQDWIWDWSSTPETQPLKTTKYKHPSYINLSIRKTAAMKSGYFSLEFLRVFIPSLILTNLFAFGFGVYIGKRLASSKTA